MHSEAVSRLDEPVESSSCFLTWSSFGIVKDATSKTIPQVWDPGFVQYFLGRRGILVCSHTNLGGRECGGMPPHKNFWSRCEIASDGLWDPFNPIHCFSIMYYPCNVLSHFQWTGHIWLVQNGEILGGICLGPPLGTKPWGPSVEGHSFAQSVHFIFSASFCFSKNFQTREDALPLQLLQGPH